MALALTLTGLGCGAGSGAGSPGTGGGSSSGGSSGTGGTIGSGGAVGSGGGTSSGGTTGSGGTATGGTSASGGAVGSGGLAATGGTIGSGGGPASGGAGPGGAGAGSAGLSGGAGRIGGGGAAGGSTAAGGTSAPASCPSNALLCEDFEAAALDKTKWTSMPAGGTLALDTSQFYGGQSALTIMVPANKQGGFLENKGAPLFPLPAAQQMFGRVMVYFDSVPDGHTDLVRGSKDGSTPWYNVGEQHAQILLNYYAGSSADCWARPSPTKAVPAKTWMCWEWKFDGPANQMQFWIDGTLSRTVDMKGDGCTSGTNTTWTAPSPFNNLRIGAYVAEVSSTTPAQMWLDDLAVGVDGRLGCPPPK
ncbi:MAG TPA: hypothetical protein VGP07_18435 [Polyangia bacterium]